MADRDEHSNCDRNISRRALLKSSAKAAMVLTVAASSPFGLGGCRTAPSEAAYDAVIHGGTIYDGTSTSPGPGDIGIRNGRIAAIGEIRGKARKTFDARGLVVTPGFIDVHTHCDLTFLKTGSKRYLAYLMPSWKGNYNYLYQGVTTVVSGNCGYGYTDADYWFSLVKGVGFGTNVAHLAPHGAIREDLFGTDQPAVLSAKQLDALKGRVAEEMRKGVVGVSTGLEYAPGLLAPTSELIEIAKVARSHGGLYTTHMRDETGRKNENGTIGILESIREAAEVGRRAEISVQISHLKIAAPTNTVSVQQMLEIIERARLEGINLHADQYPYDAGSTFITHLIPNKFKTSDGIKEEFKTERGKKEIREAIEKTFASFGPEKTLISWYPGKEELEGKTIQQIAEATKKSPADCYVEMVTSDECPTGIFFLMDMEQVKAIMPHDYIITASDGWTVPKDMMKPHPRVYGTFPRKLRSFVLDEKLMELPAAIRSMTSLPAEKFGLKDRGRIAEGFFADIAVIDLKTIRDRATYLNPHQYSEGVRYVLVNGVLSIENGQATGDRGGMIIQRG